ncbi:MAG: UxaA family hydrolase, partial [Planctomycetota bacterium]
GVLLVGLGCETVDVEQILGRIDTEGRIVRSVVMQDIGPMEEILGIAREHLREIHAFIANLQTVPCDGSALVVGLECGGSDPFSGITANPAVGLVSDRVVELGGTVILSEIPEMIGAEDALAPRIADDQLRERLFGRINDYVETAHRMGADLRGCNPTPGNIAAGLSTIEEKSLGCICKGGHSPIRQFVRYAEAPTSTGLVLMDTPGNDPESVTGMAAGGANIILFTTGVGTPLGNPVAPVIKIASNSRTAQKMADFIDIDAGQAVRDGSIEDVAEQISALLARVAAGEPSAAERNGCREFALNRLAVTF